MKKTSLFEITLIAVLAVPALVYAFVPSSVFLDVKGVWVKGDRAYLSRELPYGDVEAKWRQEIVTPSGLTCPQDGSSSGVSMYEVRSEEEPAPNFELGAWASDCLVEDAIFRTRHYVLLGGFFRLRPISSQGPVRP